MVAAFAAILACQWAGEFLVHAFAVPLPGPVLGMFMLFGFLVLRARAGARGVPHELGAAADGLLGHLSLLFVPASVGMMRYFGALSANAVTLIVAVAVSTILAQAATALAFRLLTRSQP